MDFFVSGKVVEGVDTAIFSRCLELCVLYKGLEVTFKTNTIGPLLVAKHFAPLLVGGQGAFGEQAADSKNQHAAVLVNMSAKVGSITDNGNVDHVM
nr:hypothetical protein BaRGS_025747 [Batillaria attramentaria]